jgi:hypothetical protein
MASTVIVKKLRGMSKDWEVSTNVSTDWSTSSMLSVSGSISIVVPMFPVFIE